MPYLMWQVEPDIFLCSTSMSRETGLMAFQSAEDVIHFCDRVFGKDVDTFLVVEVGVEDCVDIARKYGYEYVFLVEGGGKSVCQTKIRVQKGG